MLGICHEAFWRRSTPAPAIRSSVTPPAIWPTDAAAVVAWYYTCRAVGPPAASKTQDYEATSEDQMAEGEGRGAGQETYSSREQSEARCGDLPASLGLGPLAPCRPGLEGAIRAPGWRPGRGPCAQPPRRKAAEPSVMTRRPRARHQVSTQPNPANPNPTAAWLRGIPSPRPRPCPLVPYIPNPKAPVATYALRTSLSPLQPSPAAFHPKPYLARPWSTAIYSAQQSTKAGIDEGPSSKKRANTPYASYAVVTYVASSPPSTAAQSPAWPSGW